MLERLFPQQADDKLVVEDVFSTWLYTGNGSTQTITNGIDLAGKGGLVWSKSRVSGQSHFLIDNANALAWGLSNATNAYTPVSVVPPGVISSFNANGYTLGINSGVNLSGQANVSWTFREAPKFFDVVTYTGDGTTTRSIAHSLGAAPGCVIVKRTSGAGDWFVWHRNGTQQNSFCAKLNTTEAYENTGTALWGFPTTGFPSMTAATFSVGGSNNANEAGAQFVAYLFAHVTASDGIIQCGTFNNSGGPVTVTLGWEPQWILMKNAAGTGDWFMVDNMRGMPVGDSDPYLYANSSASENSGDIVTPTATGFVTVGLPGSTNFIYMAIRRGPMRTPTLGTSVFGVNLRTGSSVNGTVVSSPISPAGDVYWKGNRASGFTFTSRLTGGSAQFPYNTSAEITSVVNFGYDQSSLRFTTEWDSTSQSNVQYFLNRAFGFFDVVCFTPAAVTGTAVKHGLGVVPELVISKSRTAGTGPWLVSAPALGEGQRMRLNTTEASNPGFTAGKPATATEVYENHQVGNFPAAPWVAYLFASVPGVSKVGTYTGNGSSQTINCAFTTGARFVLIKRTDSTGDWYVWDSARGIVSGNDPYLALNSTAAEVTSDDSVDPDSTGFIVNQVAASNINVNGATYIFLAIA
jgi:hypothetical protein